MNRLKLYLLLITFIFVNGFTFAQVGINTENPTVTLDIVAASTGASTAEGFIAPRLTGNQLSDKNAQYGSAQNGSIIYVTDAATTPAGKTKNVRAAAYYYYDATADNGAGTNSGLWIPLTGAKKLQFYMPSVVLPVDPNALPDATNYTYSSGVFTVNLFNMYNKQYSTPQAKSLSSATLSVTADAANYDYFVLYFDPLVFTSVTILPSGQLSYTLVDDYKVSEKTFMNIMFKEK